MTGWKVTIKIIGDTSEDMVFTIVMLVFCFFTVNMFGEPSTKERREQPVQPVPTIGRPPGAEDVGC